MKRIFLRTKKNKIRNYISGVLRLDFLNIDINIQEDIPKLILNYGIRKFKISFGRKEITSYFDNLYRSRKNFKIKSLTLLSYNSITYKYKVPIKYTSILSSYIYKEKKKCVYIIKKHIEYLSKSTHKVPKLVLVNLSNLKKKVRLGNIMCIFKEKISSFENEKDSFLFTY
ncbi:hypothetical protein ACWNYH_00125 [Candidatus Vidania fulgoroideorum]